MDREAAEGRCGRTVLYGRTLPGKAAGRAGALSEGHLGHSGRFLAVVSPLALR